MKPSVAEALKARAQEELAKKYGELAAKQEEIKVQLDRIEAKLDQLLALHTAEQPVPAETPPSKSKRK